MNVSAENIATYFKHIVSQMGQPGSFLMELPAEKAEEEELRKEKTSPFHKNLYYADGISTEKAIEIFSQHERLFVHDGIINFGYGFQKDELFVGAYKIFYLYTDRPDKYREIMSVLKIQQKNQLRTLWDNFGRTSPGRRESLKEKPSIWDMLEQLKTQGFYLAETRED